MFMNDAIRDLSILCLACTLFAPQANAGPGEFRAGAARIDITPAKDAALRLAGYAARTEGHKGVHDNLYVRAIVLDDSRTKAAIVTCDLIGVPDAFWQRVSGRVKSELGIAPENLMLAGTHTHGAPAPVLPDDDSAEKQAAYIASVESSILQAIRSAQENLRAARVGAGLGRANVNMNRRAQMADGSWWLGVNPDGPSDKTVAVVKFEDLAGEPIAIFVNYAVHGTGMSQENYLITADVPGATSRYVEEHFGDKVVAPWTSGAGGDQCPIYDREARRFDGVMAIGRILGEEAIRVAAAIRTDARVSLRGAQTVITCPGQKLTPGPRRRKPEDYKFLDADPVNIRLSLLMINDIALGGVSGEVLTMIGQRLKRESGLRHTIMVTHCNGSNGYFPDDEAYKNPSYEVGTARVKPGCAESGIVTGLLRLMEAGI